MPLSIKLDENLGTRGRDLLKQDGHDVSTVAEQGLQGAGDDVLIEVCRAESRCLVTLDLDFANPIHYPPERFAGIVVLRLSRNPTYGEILDCLTNFSNAIRKLDDLDGKLWIASGKQIREFTPSNDD